MKASIAVLAVLVVVASITGCKHQQADNPTSPSDSVKQLHGITAQLRNGKDSIFPNPVITSFSPASGQVGTAVRISGENFGTNRAAAVVMFGTDTASIQSITSKEIVASVPPAALTSIISVYIASKQANSSSLFEVLFSPSVYTKASIEISKILVRTTIENTDYIAKTFTGHIDTAFSSSLDTNIGCPSSCDGKDSELTIKLCCSQSPVNSNWTSNTITHNMWIEVDTLRHRFRSITEQYWFDRDHINILMGGSDRHETDNFDLLIEDVPYVVEPDGSMVCMIESGDFASHIRTLKSGSNSYIYYYRSGRIERSSESRSTTTMLLDSPHDAFIRIVVKR
jgi:hypothetical protein